MQHRPARIRARPWRWRRGWRSRRRGWRSGALFVLLWVGEEGRSRVRTAGAARFNGLDAVGERHGRQSDPDPEVARRDRLPPSPNRSSWNTPRATGADEDVTSTLE